MALHRARDQRFRGRLNRLFSLLLNLLATNPPLTLGRHRCGRIRFGLRREFVVRRLISKFLRDESGATAIEYCLIACGIALAIIVSVQSIGPTLSTKFTAVNTSLK
jgi:pilus assembly protein Flp/PilA